MERPKSWASSSDAGRLTVRRCSDEKNRCTGHLGWYIFDLIPTGELLCVCVFVRAAACCWPSGCLKPSRKTQTQREGQIEKLHFRVIRGHWRGKADTLTSNCDLIRSLKGGGCQIVALVPFEPDKQDKQNCRQVQPVHSPCLTKPHVSQVVFSWIHLARSPCEGASERWQEVSCDWVMCSAFKWLKQMSYW